VGDGVAPAGEMESLGVNSSASSADVEFGLMGEVALIVDKVQAELARRRVWIAKRSQSFGNFGSSHLFNRVLWHGWPPWFGMFTCGLWSLQALPLVYQL